MNGPGPFDFAGALSSATTRYTGFGDPGGGYVINGSGLPDNVIADDGVLRDEATASMVKRVATQLNKARTRFAGLGNRDAYDHPRNRLEAMRVARLAFEHDDIVQGVADGTEALAFTDLGIFAPHDDEQSVWNQLAGDLNLDGFVRSAWQRLFVDSQVAVVQPWGRRTYTPTIGINPDTGRDRRTEYPLLAPLALSTLDTTRVIPVGEIGFGLDHERLAYSATIDEAERIREAIGRRVDLRKELPGGPDLVASFLTSDDDAGGLENSPLAHYSLSTLSQMFVRHYRPDINERMELERDGVTNVEYLFEFDRSVVWRHTLTKGDFERFAAVRIQSVFDLLDLKAQLHHMDRSHLMGGANYIVLITKGSDKQAATQKELVALRQNAQTMGTSTIITGDHRLHVEIITPKLDITLSKEKYDVLDQRIAARLYQSIMPSQPSTDPMKLARLIAAGLESRRKMLRRRLELKTIHEVKTRNGKLRTRAELYFAPEAIQLIFDAAYGNFILDLREAGDISRRTALGQFGFSAGREKVWRIREARKVDESGPDGNLDSGRIAAGKSDDEVFKTTIPYSGKAGTKVQRGVPRGGSPDTGDEPEDEDEPKQDATPRRATRGGGRRRGGNRNGGGADPGSNQGGARQSEPEDTRRAAAATLRDDEPEIDKVDVARRLLAELDVSVDDLTEGNQP